MTGDNNDGSGGDTAYAVHTGLEDHPTHHEIVIKDEPSTKAAEVVYIQQADDLIPSLTSTSDHRLSSEVLLEELAVSGEEEIITGDMGSSHYGDLDSEESASRSPAGVTLPEEQVTYEHQQNTVIVHDDVLLEQQTESVPVLDARQDVLMETAAADGIDVGFQEEVVLDSNAPATNETMDGVDFYISQSGGVGDGMIQLKEEEIGGYEEEIVDSQTEEEEEDTDAENSISYGSQSHHHRAAGSGRREQAEMSVAMDLANLSRGHLPNGDSMYSNGENVMPLIMHPACGDEKPRLSYAQMIAEALMNATDRMLTLSEIYAYINRKYPYYRMETKSWQNAIRHNLTLNTAFTKVPRPNNEGRGNFWRMEEGSERTIFRRALKNHHYNRGKVGNSLPSTQKQSKSYRNSNSQSAVAKAVSSIVSTSPQPTQQFIIGSDGTIQPAPVQEQETVQAVQQQQQQRIVLAPQSTSSTFTSSSFSSPSSGVQRVIRVIQPSAMTSNTFNTTTSSSSQPKVLQLSGTGSANGTKILRVNAAGGVNGANTTMSSATTAKVLKLANGKQFSIPSGQIVFIALPKKGEELEEEEAPQA